MSDEREQKVTDAIHLVKSHLSESNSYQRIKATELQTRYATIDPILSALGWDTHDPKQVGVEEECNVMDDGSTDSMKADYVLKDSKSKPVVIVEAKRLGTSLGTEGHRLQTGGYAWFKGTEVMVLTEGQYWEIYEKDERGEIIKESIDLMKEEPEDVKSRKLLKLTVEKWKNTGSSEDDK